jgi:hypothetical protein
MSFTCRLVSLQHPVGWVQCSSLFVSNIHFVKVVGTMQRRYHVHRVRYADIRHQSRYWVIGNLVVDLIDDLIDIVRRR